MSIMKKKYFYEKNYKFLRHPVNREFADILTMSNDDFSSWVIEMRKVVVDLWDNEGLPPRVGYDELEIVKQFDRMSTFPVNKFAVVDEYTGENNCIRNTSNLGNAANQWFPTMMKTRINYKANDDGLSIYDHFIQEELLEKVIKYASRHFKRDSFYAYSTPVQAKNIDSSLFYAETGVEWIEKFNSSDYDYWIQPYDIEKEYTGYDSVRNSKEVTTLEGETVTHSSSIKDREFLTLSKSELETLNLSDHRLTNATDSEHYWLRLYKTRGNKLFPSGLKAFRISWCQYAVNFPPLTAKYLYEKYTDSGKLSNIWDPSAGWGGRILGAMSVRDDRSIHYIGNDPNTDHNIDDGLTKYHDLATFFNTRTTRANPNLSFFDDNAGPNTFEIYQLGSEVIQYNPDFQKYRGNIDLVFTSPPYFAKEAYSEDEEQSYKKFGTYGLWRDGFLKPTLETAYHWLRPGGYLLWNIADAKFGKDVLPLEQDSNDILTNLGMEYIGTEKMCLAQMPGGNRIGDDGKPKTKNFCKVNGMWLKYEPVFVYRRK